MISLTHPNVLYILIPLAIFIIILVKMELVRGSLEYGAHKRKLRAIVVITRLLIVSLLILALAGPYTQLTLTEASEPEILVLVDNTTSMEIFEFDSQVLINELKKEAPTSVHYIGSGMRSSLADGILENMKRDRHILLVSDGYNNYGSSLGDAALSATAQNISINAVELTPKKKEVSVWIEGPKKVITNVENTWSIYVKKINTPEANLRIIIDDIVVYDRTTSTDKVTISRSFDGGQHRIIADVDSEDHFSQNNIFYKSIKVIERPKVLLVTKKASPLNQLLDELYEMEQASSLPKDLSGYYAVIINDMPAGAFTTSDIDNLRQYLLEQNGLFVIGGFNSFDRGNYKNSGLEELLPVRVGAAEKTQGDNDLVIILDISGSASGTRFVRQGNQWVEVQDPVSQLDIMKAFAVDIVKQLNIGNNVGAIAFTDRPFLIQDIQPLYQTKQELIDKLTRLKWTPGASNMDEGIRGGYELIKNQKRAKSLIVLTDGKASASQGNTIELARAIAYQGIRFYVVGVGRTDLNIDEAFLKWVAEAGNGIYFRADQSNKLSVLFGEPEDIAQGESFPLFILNSNHFITRDLELSATMNGFNQVIPKNSARLLVTSTAGDPALTIWHYGGLGRAAALNVFSGGTLGQLLNEENSEFISRIVNWAIADPERKKEYSISIDDVRINEQAFVAVTSDKMPVAEGLVFTKAGVNSYESSQFYPPGLGFNSILSQDYAVNYELEYQYFGMSPILNQITASTGGKIFKPSQTKEIAEHVRKLSRKQIVKRMELTWPLIALALLVFLTEIIIRKAYEHKK